MCEFYISKKFGKAHSEKYPEKPIIWLETLLCLQNMLIVLQVNGFIVSSTKEIWGCFLVILINCFLIPAEAHSKFDCVFFTVCSCQLK